METCIFVVYAELNHLACFVIDVFYNRLIMTTRKKRYSGEMNKIIYINLVPLEFFHTDADFRILVIFNKNKRSERDKPYAWSHTKESNFPPLNLCCLHIYRGEDKWKECFFYQISNFLHKSSMSLRNHTYAMNIP